MISGQTTYFVQNVSYGPPNGGPSAVTYGTGSSDTCRYDQYTGRLAGISLNRPGQFGTLLVGWSYDNSPAGRISSYSPFRSTPCFRRNAWIDRYTFVR